MVTSSSPLSAATASSVHSVRFIEAGTCRNLPAIAAGPAVPTRFPLPRSSSYGVEDDDPPLVAKTKALAKAAFADNRFVEDIENGQSAARASLNNVERFGRCYLGASWTKGQASGTGGTDSTTSTSEEEGSRSAGPSIGQNRGGVWAWLGYSRGAPGDQ